MKFSQLRLIGNVTLHAFKNSLKLTMADSPKYLDMVKNEVIYKKVNEINSWYTRIIGLDEVKLCQDRVVALEEKLLAAQENRREITVKLSEIRKRSNELHDQIHKVKRHDDLQLFLDLMKEETKVLQTEQEVSKTFNECDRTEREIFTAFTNAVRVSHEKQRAQLEYTKYFGLVLSLVGSFLTFCYSTLRKEDLKKFIEENIRNASGNSLPIISQLETYKKQLEELVASINKENPTFTKAIEHNHEKIIQLLTKINTPLPQESKSRFMEMKEFPETKTLVWYGSVFLVGWIILKSIIG